MPIPSSVPSATSRAIPEFLGLEIAQRMAEKLEVVRLQPKKIGHLGKLNLNVLGSYYPDADHH